MKILDHLANAPFFLTIKKWIAQRIFGRFMDSLTNSDGSLNSDGVLKFFIIYDGDGPKYIVAVTANGSRIGVATENLLALVRGSGIAYEENLLADYMRSYYLLNQLENQRKKMENFRISAKS
ncbi:hypothetical protein [Paracidovorax avenae]|uniref:hypothetical protein n=1 Tax=Paracidovorax avenae TaxID=80867 RepID=UPI0012601C58|nr:hypothetical protein [Paracidovorax avenae]